MCSLCWLAVGSTNITNPCEHVLLCLAGLFGDIFLYQVFHAQCLSLWYVESWIQHKECCGNHTKLYTTRWLCACKKALFDLQQPHCLCKSSQPWDEVLHAAMYTENIIHSLIIGLYWSGSLLVCTTSFVQGVGCDVSLCILRMSLSPEPWFLMDPT